MSLHISLDDLIIPQAWVLHFVFAIFFLRQLQLKLVGSWNIHFWLYWPDCIPGPEIGQIFHFLSVQIQYTYSNVFPNFNLRFLWFSLTYISSIVSKHWIRRSLWSFGNGQKSYGAKPCRRGSCPIIWVEFLRIEEPRREGVTRIKKLSVFGTKWDLRSPRSIIYFEIIIPMLLQ